MRTLPNIIFIITHDTGTYFGCYGKPVKTPNIDNLASEGVLFTHHFACAPQCTPSRGGILTGKMPHSNGLMGLTNMGWNLPDYNDTIPKLLKKAGYSTHLVGLQHTQHHPKKLGYDTISPRSDFPNMGSTVVRRFKKFMERVEKGEIQKPFFCSVGFFETHRYHGFTSDDSSPFNASKPRYPANPSEVRIPSILPQESMEVREDITDFVSAVKDVDNYVGKIRSFIEESSIKDTTLILFTVDHGIPIPRHKCTLYDPGIHVPLIMHMPPKLLAGKNFDDLVSNIDILPTLLDIAEIPIPQDIQGFSFAGLILKDPNIPYNPRDHIIAELTFHDMGFNPIRCIRTKKWKYIKNLVPLKVLFEIPNDVSHSKSGIAYVDSHPEYHSTRPAEELYDLDSDPLELKNLANDPEYKNIKAELNAKLMQFLQNTDDPALKKKLKEPKVPKEGPERYIYDLEIE